VRTSRWGQETDISSRAGYGRETAGASVSSGLTSAGTAMAAQVPARIRVVIGADGALGRFAPMGLLATEQDHHVVAAAAGVGETAAAVGADGPGVVAMDPAIDDADGVEAARVLKTRRPHTPAVT
jgi:CheY-like chemotaxis protein